MAVIHFRCLDVERNVVGSRESGAAVSRHKGRGYLGDCGVVTKSTVRRMLESRLVLTQDGEVWESRFEGERGLVKGV